MFFNWRKNIDSGEFSGTRIETPNINREPALDEVLTDPIVKMLMSVDNVDDRDILKLVSKYRKSTRKAAFGYAGRLPFVLFFSGIFDYGFGRNQ